MKAIIHIIIIFAALNICSCRSTQYVPVESVRYDSVYFNKLVRDSIYVKDSVLIVKGDTIKEYRYKYIYQYKDRIDTVYKLSSDTIKVPYPVEKKLTKWQQFKQDVGGFAITAMIVIICLVIVLLIYRTKK